MHLFCKYFRWTLDSNAPRKHSDLEHPTEADLPSGLGATALNDPPKWIKHTLTDMFFPGPSCINTREETAIFCLPQGGEQRGAALRGQIHVSGVRGEDHRHHSLGQDEPAGDRGVPRGDVEGDRHPQESVRTWKNQWARSVQVPVPCPSDLLVQPLLLNKKYLNVVSPLQSNSKTAMSPMPSSSWFLTCECSHQSLNRYFKLVQAAAVQKLCFLSLRMKRGELFDYLTEKVTLSEKETR